jgi:hypothetical protein
MWLGWVVLSALFASMYSRPDQSWAKYDVAQIQSKNRSLTEDEARRLSVEWYRQDLAHYHFFYRLAGRGEGTSTDPLEQHPGRLRIAPWDEDRGPNPFLLVTGRHDEVGRFGPVYEPGHFWEWMIKKEIPVLIEPLVKFLEPVIAMLSKDCDGFTRFYLLLVTLWTLVVWAFFGGAITRIAALQFAGRDTVGLFESLRFVAERYGHYLAAPLVPLLFVAGIVLVSVLFGLIHLIPGLGDLWDGVLWPVPLLLAFAQALLLVGLVGYPLMYATISAEGSDTFDALSRSYNYVYQSPWAYVWNALVAIAYGMVVVFFIAFMGSFVVYLSKWSVSQTPGTETFVSRRVDHLFAYAPNSYEWHDLLVDRPELKSTALPSTRAAYWEANTYWTNNLSAFLVGLWVTLVLLFVVGFGYSYFFSASTMIYLLMRHRVDDTEIDEVYTDDDFPDDALLPPVTTGAATMATTTGAPQTQMVDAPTLRTPPVTTPEATAPEKPA